MKKELASLIVGGDGLIGQAIAEYLTQKGEMVYATSRRAHTIMKQRSWLDLGQDISTWQPSCQCRVAYLCAAVPSLEQCRKNPDYSRIINVQHTLKIAETLVAQGAFVIFLSTNLVYDGSIAFRSASDAVCPQTTYGRQKAEAEKLLLDLGEHVSIVRLTKVLYPTMPLFTGWIESLKKEMPIHPFSDMVMAPVALAFVVRVLCAIAAHHLPGITQVSGQQDLTYEQAARYLARKLGVSLELIQPMSAKESAIQFEDIPKHTTLDTTWLSQELGIVFPDVWSTIDSVFGV